MKDITPPNGKRSIRNVIPQSKDGDFTNKNNSTSKNRLGSSKVRDFKIRPRNTENPDKEDKKQFSSSQGNHNYSKIQSTKKPKKKWLLWLIGSVSLIAVIVIVGFGVSSQFATAEVSVTPISVETEFNQNITAYKEQSSENLGFEIITVSLNQPRTVSVEASGEEYVEEKASGLITIYNEFTASQQVLVKNTRFESPEGYIYRINKNVTIPGMSNGNPGTTQIEVYADDFGSEYNIEPSTFTIPGFKGSPQFDGFYAKSESPMTGGKKGNSPIVNEEDFAKAEEKLREGIEDELSQNASDLVPDGFILFDNAYSIEDKKEIVTDSENVTLNLNAYLHGVLLKEDSLVAYLYKEATGNTEPVEVKDWSDIKIEIQSTDNVKNAEQIEFKVSGKLEFFRIINTEKLAEELTGVSFGDKEKIESIFDEEGHPIYKAEVTNRSPFWMPNFPGNSEKIDINILY